MVVMIIMVVVPTMLIMVIQTSVTMVAVVMEVHLLLWAHQWVSRSSLSRRFLLSSSSEGNVNMYNPGIASSFNKGKILLQVAIIIWKNYNCSYI